MRSARVYLCLFVFAIIFLFFPKTFAAAQTNSNYPPSTTSTESFRAPNMDPDVPRNQHTYAQATTIEVLSAVYCILTGVDPINPTLGCLGINPETKKLGLSKPIKDEYGRQEISGLIGATSGLIASTYEPIASTGTYTQYLSDSFGIVKKVHANVAPCSPTKSGYGFCGLQPILRLWETVRNVAYALLTIAFIFIGVGIMLRVKIDPRTVMTIQNQIPKVIVSIILITLSYGIAALMIDAMWVTTYAGTYLLTKENDPAVGDCQSKKKEDRKSLSNKVTSTILDTPFTFFNQVFALCTPEDNVAFLPENDHKGGFNVLTRQVSNNIGQTIGNVARSLIFDEEDTKTSCGWGAFRNPIRCAKKGLINVLVGVVTLVVMLVVFVILVITMFKIWFALLKAYIYALIYIIVGPLYIVFGLLPSKPLGFEKWLRGVFVNVAIFPLTAFLFVIARLLMELYSNKPVNQFVPPLIGNPSSTNFGALMAFGVLLLIPNVQTILREKMGVKGVGSPGLIGAAISGGAGIVGAPVSRAMKHLNRHDSSGHAVGAMAVGKDKAGDWALGRASKSKYNPFKEATKRKLEEREYVKGTSDPLLSAGRKKAEIRAARRDPKHKFWETDAGKALKTKEEADAESGGKVNYSWLGRKRAGSGSSGPGGGSSKQGWRPWRRSAGTPHPSTTTPHASTATSGTTDFKASSTLGADHPASKIGGADGSAGAGGARGGSVKHDSGGSVTITGPVTATGQVIGKGGSAAEAKQSFIGSKVDEYMKKLSTDGKKASSSKKDITIHLEEALKEKGPEDLANMHEPEWERLYKEAEEKEKGKGE
ncbi:MAG TPA: hypothetical protein VM077_00015 [Candidatus Limnocylindrales bacterium]|nr:hypothetical protein [Candidatus Limnocylindrales bacterium]